MKFLDLTYRCSDCGKQSTFNVAAPDEGQPIPEPENKVCQHCSTHSLNSYRSNGTLGQPFIQEREWSVDSYFDNQYGHHRGTTMKPGIPITGPMPTPPPEPPVMTKDEKDALIDDYLFRMVGYSVPKRGER